MIYTLKKAEMVAEQLRRFTSGFAHHVVGQYANIDFWMAEVLTAQQTLDQYKARLDNMSKAQSEWVENHGTPVYTEYCPICGGKCEFDNGLNNSRYIKRTPSKVINATRTKLVNSTYYFLARCYRMGLLNDEELKEKCDAIGTGIDPGDLGK
jgi:hypothetical protein